MKPRSLRITHYASRITCHVSRFSEHLLSNALKLTPSGGDITFSAHSNQDYITVTITDTGCGIDQEGLNELFRIDTQYTNPGTDGEKGSGLGLVLCKELIEQNQGKILVESQPGVGTTFTFTLPRSS
jgi:signal transduction histidine kinase